MTACICRTCDHWHEGESPLAAATPERYPLAKPSIGTCTLYAPVVAETKWFPVTVFPEVHAERTCGDWTPRAPADPDDGERVTTDNVVPLGRAA